MLSFANRDGSMVSFEFESPVQTELVEIPVIIVHNEVQLISPEFKALSDDTLKNMAIVMGGIVGYLKVRAYYQTVETQHCTKQGCWRPAVEGAHRCDSHAL